MGSQRVGHDRETKHIRELGHEWQNKEILEEMGRGTQESIIYKE